MVGQVARNFEAVCLFFPLVSALPFFYPSLPCYNFATGLDWLLANLTAGRGEKRAQYAVQCSESSCQRAPLRPPISAVYQWMSRVD